MSSLHPSHLTHSPSGTVLRGRSWRIGFGFLVLRNQAMRGSEARSGLRGVAPLLGIQVVGDAEPHTGRVVHLARGLLGVLQLGQAVLHLGELLLDHAIELFHLLARDGESVLVELPLLVAEAHALLRHHSLNGILILVHILTRTPSLVAGRYWAPRATLRAASLMPTSCLIRSNTRAS